MRPRPAGSFSFRLPTTSSGSTAYRVTVTGASIVTTHGATLTLGVFQVGVTKVSPRGREFVTLANTGSIATEIGGWRLRDRSGKVLVLPSHVLAPGAKVKVFTGKGRRRPHALFLGRHVDMWWAIHDTVHLYDGRGTPVGILRY